PPLSPRIFFTAPKPSPLLPRGRAPRLCRGRRRREDLLRAAEDVLRVPLPLERREPPEVAAVRRAHAFVALFLGQEVDVSAAGGEAAQVAPCAARPRDPRLVAVGLLPGAGDVEHEARVAVAHRRVVARQLLDGAADGEED